MDRCPFILLVIFVCVQSSHEDCNTEPIRQRQKCYYYDNDYNNYGHYYRHNYNQDESSCWTQIGSKVICYREKTIPLAIDAKDYTVLEIFDSDISTIPHNSFKSMPRLSTINITNCNVSKIETGAFDGIINLQKLHLSKNKINHVEEGTFLELNLNEIYIKDNEIENLSPFVENCKDLKIFDLSYNKVSTLESMDNCTSLTELYASNNRIKELSTYLFTPLPLVILDLSSNILVDIDIETFNGLGSLETLDLSGNKINNGQPNIGIFQHLQSLRKLNLSSNSITNLQLGIFSKLSSLEILDLSNNELSSLPDEMFHDLGSLTKIYIQNNQLSNWHIPETALKEIDIDGNPWNCQQLAKIVTMYKGSMRRGNNHNTSNIFGVSCIPTSNKNAVPVDNNLSENDKIGYASLLRDFLDSLKKSNNELFRQNENISSGIQQLLEDSDDKNQNFFALIQKYLDQNQENYKTTLKQNQNSSNSLKDLLKVLVTQTQNSNNALKDYFNVIMTQIQNSSNILKEILSQNNNHVIKQENEHDSTKIGADILEKFSQKAEQQFEKLLSIFNGSQPEKDYTYKQEIIQSERLGGNIVIPHENSNIFVGVLTVLIVFLIVFCLTVFYFIRTTKTHQQIREMGEIQL